MAETATDTHKTIAVRFEVPDPRVAFSRVKQWILAGGETARPSALSPQPGRRFRQDTQVQQRTAALYTGSW